MKCIVMLMRRAVIAAAFATTAGCATLGETFNDNAQCGAHPYCGTATDVEYLKGLTDGNAGPLAAFIPLVIIDIPLSLAADTLFLPYTVFNGPAPPRP